MVDDSNKLINYKCNSCGKSFLTTNQNTITNCIFCGNTDLESKDSSIDNITEIISFSKTKDEAFKNYKNKISNYIRFLCKLFPDTSISPCHTYDKHDKYSTQNYNIICFCQSKINQLSHIYLIEFEFCKHIKKLLKCQSDVRICIKHPETA